MDFSYGFECLISGKEKFTQKLQRRKSSKFNIETLAIYCGFLYYLRKSFFIPQPHFAIFKSVHHSQTFHISPNHFWCLRKLSCELRVSSSPGVNFHAFLKFLWMTIIIQQALLSSIIVSYICLSKYWHYFSVLSLSFVKISLKSFWINWKFTRGIKNQ